MIIGNYLRWKEYQKVIDSDIDSRTITTVTKTKLQYFVPDMVKGSAATPHGNWYDVPTVKESEPDRVEPFK